MSKEVFYFTCLSLDGGQEWTFGDTGMAGRMCRMQHFDHRRLVTRQGYSAPLK